MVKLCKKKATKIEFLNGYTCIRYYSTNVVEFKGKEVILNSGNYQTLSTKSRMNQASSEFGLGFRVFAKDFRWYVEYDGMVLKFHDGMELKKEADLIVDAL